VQGMENGGIILMPTAKFGKIWNKCFENSRFSLMQFLGIDKKSITANIVKGKVFCPFCTKYLLDK
jgi:hypothetical protein